MKYYLHDSNSFNDEKVHELYLNYGYEGLGLFYTILEKLAAQEKPIKTKVLKSQLGVNKKLEKIWTFLEETLMISSQGGDTFNENLLTFCEKFQIKKQKNLERISQWRDKQQVKKNVTHSESVGNAPKLNKVNKVNVFIKIGDKVVFQKPSDWLKENKQISIDNLMSSLLHGLDANKIYEKLDGEKIGYNFRDENHIYNSFKEIGGKIKNTKSPGIVHNSQPAN